LSIESKLFFQGLLSFDLLLNEWYILHWSTLWSFLQLQGGNK